MHIRTIHIENIRGFRDATMAVDLDLSRPDGSLAGWTVLAGPNGAGKTTLLQTIALTLLGRESLLGDDPITWLHEGAESGKAHIEVASGPRGKIQGRETMTCNFELSSDSAGFGPLSEVRNGSHLQGFLAGYGPFRRISGHTSDALRIMSASTETSRVVTLFREDASLAEAVQWLREINYRKLENRAGASALEETALLLLKDDLLPAVQIEKVDSEGLWVRRNGTSLPLARLSDGFRSVTALVLDLLRHLHQAFGELTIIEKDGRPAIPYDGVVLIDEADAHLHASWQKRLGFWFKEHFPNIQFIVTTHSPFICQAADPQGLVRLPTPDEERPVAHVPESVYRAVVNGSVDNAVLSELFGLESPFSEKADSLRRRVAQLEARLQSHDISDEERAELSELRQRLPRNIASDVEQTLRRLAFTL